MKVQAKDKSSNWLLPSLRAVGYSENTIFDVVSGKIYDVHAIVVWQGFALYQLVGKSGIISWIPASFFQVIDSTIPNDWEINRFDEEVDLILAPNYFCHCKDAYAAMVELDPEMVSLFMARLNSMVDSSIEKYE